MQLYLSFSLDFIKIAAERDSEGNNYMPQV